MASLHQREGWFQLHFRYRGRQYSRALKTKDRREAEAIRGSVDRMLLRLQLGELAEPPSDTDFVTWLLTGGRRTEEVKPAKPPLTLAALRDRYVQTHSNGALEPKSLKMIEIHYRHLIRHLGERAVVAQLTPTDLQGYLDARLKHPGRNGRHVSPVTVQKDLASLRAGWNWAVRVGELAGTYPGRSLTYPKFDEKPGFQTWEEIERKIARGGLSKGEVGDLWECLFLTKTELDEFLAFAKAMAGRSHLYPMLVTAAHTGARRSELIRMRIDDLDFAAGMAVIREKKKARGRRTTRRVPISGFLRNVLGDWMQIHPGGPMMFAWVKDVEQEPSAIHPMMAYEQFRRLVKDTKWDVLRGWHVLRHSFISVCAGEGVDQRVLQGWVGHLSSATHRRYTHLIPSKEQQIMSRVFG
jgi:integrase